MLIGQVRVVIGPGVFTLKAIERGSLVFFELTHTLGLSVGARDRVLGFWSRLVATCHALQAVRSFLSVRSGRSALASNRGTALWDIANFRQPGRRYLRLVAEDSGETIEPDVLIFGHTHRQGIAEVDPQLDTEERVREVLHGELEAIGDIEDVQYDFHLVNTGCWMREVDKPNEGNIDIVAAVEAGRIVLYRFEAGELAPIQDLVLADAIGTHQQANALRA